MTDRAARPGDTIVLKRADGRCAAYSHRTTMAGSMIGRRWCIVGRMPPDFRLHHARTADPGRSAASANTRYGGAVAPGRVRLVRLHRAHQIPERRKIDGAVHSCRGRGSVLVVAL